MDILRTAAAGFDAAALQAFRASRRVLQEGAIPQSAVALVTARHTSKAAGALARAAVEMDTELLRSTRSARRLDVRA